MSKQKTRNCVCVRGENKSEGESILWMHGEKREMCVRVVHV